MQASNCQEQVATPYERQLHPPENKKEGKDADRMGRVSGEGEDSNALGGTNATIHDYSYDLSAFSSESNIAFRFRFRSDPGTVEEGVMIDDLVVILLPY